MADESYAAVVWRQFKKNRQAYIALWMLAPLYLTALCAPLLASNVPFVFYDGNETLYPWWNALFHSSTSVNPLKIPYFDVALRFDVDYAFNMALLAVVPWAIVAIPTWLAAKRNQIAFGRRVTWLILEYVGLSAALMILFSIPGVTPNNRYSSTNFPRLEFESPSTRRGVYPPIPFGPLEVDVPGFQPPGFVRAPQERRDSNDGVVHLLGTDDVGRDVLARMIYGTRIAVTVGFFAVGIYLSIGVVVGAVAGYFGGWVDLVISRIIEVVMLFPAFFLILTIVGMLGPSLNVIMLVIGLTSWPGIARLIRGEVLKQRSLDYVQAARALGASHTRIIFKHILPNAITPALVHAPFGIAGAITTEAGLSLLGFGVKTPTPTWGELLRLGNTNYSYWWLITFPSLAIFFTLTIFNLVGNGLRDAMDPRLRR